MYKRQDKFDGELTIGSIVGIKKSEDFTSKRVDNAPVKRVELHCHTKMSDMDGVSEVKDPVSYTHLDVYKRQHPSAQDVRTRMYLTRSKWITTEHRHRSSRSEISPFRRQE